MSTPQTDNQVETEAKSEPLTRCCYCGVTSDWKEGFVDASSFRTGPGWACVSCNSYRDMFPNFYFKVVIGAVFFLALGYNAKGTVPDAIAFCVIAFITAYATIAIHELAHAAAATLVGVGVPVFSIGGGRHTHVRKMAGRWLIFGLMPSEGLIITAYPSKRWFRVKSALITAAGPLINLATAAMGTLWLRHVGDDWPAYPTMTVQMLIVFGLLTGFLNLIPFRFQTPYGPMSSDGLAVFELLKTTDEQVEQTIKQTTFVVAYFEFLFGEKSEVIRMLEPSLQDEDADVATKILATAAFANSGESDQSIELCRSTLESDELDRIQRAVLLNNLAYSLQLKNSPELLEEADRLSKQAYELTPMLLPIRSTRALILAATGRDLEALHLAQDKRYKIEPKVVQSEVMCTQATAYSNLGEHERAAECLAKAEELDPGSKHVARVSRYLSRR